MMNTATRTGNVPSEIPIEIKNIVNKIFSTFKITYPGWNSGLDQQEISYKRRQWSYRLMERIRPVSGEDRRAFMMRMNDRVNHALKLTESHYPDRAPTVNSFVKLCLKRPEHQRGEAKLALPGPGEKKTESIARSHLDNLKRLTRGKSNG